MWIQPHFLKCVKHVPSLQSFRCEESCFFLDASLKAENHFKAYKSGQRNIKNFSENYKY